METQSPGECTRPVASGIVLVDDEGARSSRAGDDSAGVSHRSIREESAHILGIAVQIQSASKSDLQKIIGGEGIGSSIQPEGPLVDDRHSRHQVRAEPRSKHRRGGAQGQDAPSALDQTRSTISLSIATQKGRRKGKCTSSSTSAHRVDNQRRCIKGLVQHTPTDGRSKGIPHENAAAGKRETLRVSDGAVNRDRSISTEGD